MNIIVAMCKNRGIGINGMLPWSLKEDMRFFRNKTIGNGNNAIIMGRKTFDSIPNTLPKRRNYVISSTKHNDLEPDNVTVYSDIIQANYDIVTRKYGYDDIWVVGGEQLYNWYICNNLIKDVYVTNIQEDYECTSFFPTLPGTFKKIESGNVILSKENKIPYNIDVYRNKFYNLKTQDELRFEFLKELDRVGYYGLI